MHAAHSMAHGQHDPALVFLSIVIAVFASYTALDLAGRIKAAEGQMRLRWLAAGAIALGGGIWSMHFVAMLAFSLDMPIAYGFTLTLLSLIAAIGVVAIGLFIVSRDTARSHTLALTAVCSVLSVAAAHYWDLLVLSPSVMAATLVVIAAALYGVSWLPAWTRNLILAGTFTGLGIATMHYTGMAAMKMNATISYEPILFVLSVVIAIVASIVALWLAMRLEHRWEKIAAGFVMGAAIAGMHYTAMAASIFTPLAVPIVTDDSADTIPLLAGVISVATFGVLLLGLLSSTVDRRFAAQAEREAEALRRSERIFRAVVDTAHDAFIAINAHGRITFWNAQAEKTFGWTVEEAIGRTVSDLIIPPQYREGHRAGFKRFIETGQGRVLNQRLELSALNKDGREFPVEISISATRVDDQVTVNAFIHDISDRKNSERELIAARDQAQAANRAKSAFLANMSHELRTPLNAVIGFSSIMSQDLPAGARSASSHREYARDIHHAGQHLLDLINDILDLSRAEQDQLDIVEEVFDVAEAVAMSISTVREAAASGGIDFAVSPTSDLPRMYGDPRRIRQILINLLSNAVKFTPHGGRVRLRAEATLTDDLVFVVEDTGPGMTPHQIKIALSPFEQVDNRLARRFSGAGLGLPLSKRLAEMHQGTLEIVASETGGTKVTVRFPAARIRPKSSVIPIAKQIA